MNKTFLLGLMLILVVGLATAIPGIPHQFYGTVSLNGAPAPDGTSVTATVDGVKAGEGTTSGGKYGYNPLFLVEDPNNNRGGKTINFYVNGEDTGQTATFVVGGNTELNLSVTISQPSSSGGGGGGGGGGSSCTPKWECTAWTECLPEGKMTRTCTDKNNCRTTAGKPAEIQTCNYVPPKTTTTQEEEPETTSGEVEPDLTQGPGSPETTGAIVVTNATESSSGSITGRFIQNITGSNKWMGIGIIILVLLVGWLFYFFVLKKKQKKK